MVNAGQSCIAGKRFIVVGPVAGGIRGGVRRGDARPTRWAIRAIRRTKLGPLQSVAARDQIHEQVEESVAAGARLLQGGESPTGRVPGIRRRCSTDVRPGQPAHDEEMFGPVAAIIEAADEEDAVRIANASSSASARAC